MKGQRFSTSQQPVQSNSDPLLHKLCLLSCMNTIFGGLRRPQLNFGNCRMTKGDRWSLPRRNVAVVARSDMNINDWWFGVWGVDWFQSSGGHFPREIQFINRSANENSEATISLLSARISALSANSVIAIIRCVLCKDKGHYFCAGAAGSLMCENRLYSYSVYLITFQVTRHDLCLASVQNKHTAAFKM